MERVGVKNPVRRTEVDGVPTYWADVAGPFRACLAFRVGRPHERCTKSMPRVCSSTAGSNRTAQASLRRRMRPQADRGSGTGSQLRDGAVEQMPVLGH